MKKVFIAIMLVIMFMFLASCAPGPNELTNTKGEKVSIAGFWQGLWNGIIAPVTFIISLFNKNIQMYEVHNNGNWYNFGFILGLIVILGGGSSGASSRRARH